MSQKSDVFSFDAVVLIKVLRITSFRGKIRFDSNRGKWPSVLHDAEPREEKHNLHCWSTNHLKTQSERLMKQFSFKFKVWFDWLITLIVLLPFLESSFWVHFNCSHKMVCTRKRKNQQKRQHSQLKETMDDSDIDNNTNTSAMKNETLEPQTNSLPNNFGRTTASENSVCQDQVIEKNIDDKIRRAVDSAVMIVENRMLDAILTAVDNVLIPRV